MASTWECLFHFHSPPSPFGAHQAARSSFKDAFGQYLDAPDRNLAALQMVSHLRDLYTKAVCVLRASQTPHKSVCALKCLAAKHRDDPVLSVLSIVFQMAEVSLSAPSSPQQGPTYNQAYTQQPPSNPQQPPEEDYQPSAPPLQDLPRPTAQECLRRLNALEIELKQMRDLMSRLH
jgi:hypothetical protein